MISPRAAVFAAALAQPHPRISRRRGAEADARPGARDALQLARPGPHRIVVPRPLCGQRRARLRGAFTRRCVGRHGREERRGVRGDALEFARGARSRFDVVFVDPPYRLGLQAAALALVRGLLVEGGRVYAESEAALETPQGWIILKNARAGKVHFHLLGKTPDDQGGVSGNV